MSRLMAFIDGENLTSRFESMVKNGRVPRTKKESMEPLPIVRKTGQFVWSPSTFSRFPYDDDLLRVCYYTTFSGSDDAYRDFQKFITEQKITKLVFTGSINRYPLQLIPKVFKKEKRATRTKSVDINICVDVLDYVRQDALDGIILITGDVDYIPLIETVMKAGKQAYVAALSDGLSPHLRSGFDGFFDLDEIYFCG